MLTCKYSFLLEMISGWKLKITNSDITSCRLSEETIHNRIQSGMKKEKRMYEMLLSDNEKKFHELESKHRYLIEDKDTLHSRWVNICFRYHVIKHLEYMLLLHIVDFLISNITCLVKYPMHEDCSSSERYSSIELILQNKNIWKGNRKAHEHTSANKKRTLRSYRNQQGDGGRK